jgi:quinoprotein glucose dehydrogenase
MGPYYIPPSALEGGPNGYHCSWYAPGAAGGVNIDSGAAADPETGMLYVGSQSGLSTTEVAHDPCSELRYTQGSSNGPHDSCGLPGALPAPAGYQRPEGGRGGRGGGPPTTIGGVSILKPAELGGITAYDLNSGDRKWWIANGGMVPVTSDDPLFRGVTLPPAPARGQPQVINTKTLVIYGTGRSGGPPGQEPTLFAVDKATGRQVGAVEIPSKTSAMPMTFMHQGRQYIVFATGAGSNTSLVALTLPRGR